jgi:hypothetical protein
LSLSSSIIIIKLDLYKIDSSFINNNETIVPNRAINEVSIYPTNFDDFVKF